MNRYALLWGCLASFATQIVSAQTGPDYQLRLPIHFQLTEIGNGQTKNRLGLAGWVVLPNVMAPNNQTALLLVGGLLWRQGPSGSWIEFLGGSRFNQNGYADPLVNIRFSNNYPQGINLYGEIGSFFRAKQRRSYLLLAADFPIPLGKSGLRLGAESENTYFPKKPDSWGVGPRVVVLLPVTLFSLMRVSVTTAYQCFRTDRPFIRTYVTATIKSP